jgi:hypothetical protein
MRHREDTERSQNVGSGSDSNLSTASLTMKDSFSSLEEDKKSVILINIAGLSGKAAWLEEVVLPDYVITKKYLFRLDTLIEEATIQKIIGAAVADLVRLIKKSIEDY